MFSDESGNKKGLLGFGLMRLPVLGSETDLEQVKKMVDHFLSKGFNYFDTAYVYGNGKSEEIARRAIVERYPRDSFLLADKLPIWEVHQKSDLQRIFDTSLQRCGVTYFDYYLLHNVGSERARQYEEYDAWSFLFELKRKGLAKNVGFSFHDTAALLDQVLTQHPEVDFVQLQINYGDWEDPIVQSRLCYETARRHHKPVIVMEPVKGGSLVSVPPEAASLLQAENPAMSPAAWALKFAASLDGVFRVLSGMSSLDQMMENTLHFTDFKPLTQSEKSTLEKVRNILKELPTIPCTMCKYCLDGCPQAIPIPLIFKVYNSYVLYNNMTLAQRGYNWETRNGQTASTCLQCGACEHSCPQHIAIIKSLQSASELFDK
ncbi:MAG: aldo/keto reductase [Christensenellales bacterium]